MHSLLKSSISYQLMVRQAITQAEIDVMEDPPTKEIYQAMQDFHTNKLSVLIKTNWLMIKNDPLLLDEIATFIANKIARGYTIEGIGFPNKTHQELIDKVFQIVMNMPHYHEVKGVIHILDWWGDILSPDAIRQFTAQILNRLKEASEHDKWEMHTLIQDMLQNPRVRPHINTALFEKVLSYHDPSRLPEFNPEKPKFNTTDIIAMLKGNKRDKLHNLDYPKLLEIISKSTPPAQELLRSVLWQSYGGYSQYTSKKFMLDAENKAIDVNMKPVEVYGKISPANNVSWNQYAVEEMSERDKWHQVFNDFGIVPFIEF